MNAEDALLARDDYKPRKRDRQEDTKPDNGRKRGRTREGRDDRRPKPPTGRYTNFTPLNTPIDQVLMQIKDEENLAFPGKLKGDPNRRPRDKYCRFHQDHGHDTADCYDLKQQIEALIRRGRLQRFVNKERANPPQNQAPRQDNDRPRQPVRDIRMIVGGTARAGSSKKARKAYIRTIQNVQSASPALGRSRIGNPPIEFSKVDAQRLHHPHDDALVVTIRAGDYNIHRVLVDNGSSADILYYPAFQQMRIERERLIPVNAPLIGFGGARVHPLGTVTLAVTVGDYPQQVTRNITFLLADGIVHRKMGALPNGYIKLD
ncbi:uncharacterized protein LOC142616796 [Castanea sativa]|uniref:uncharacterized protein LOC142616796 n=1 Tax=Castanea sativa TaxID=21020 RepID=UPI003F64BA2E